MARAARPRMDADRVDRTERIRTFTYGPRHRWAYAPTAGFLIVVFGILAIRPDLLWPTGVDEQVRRAALLLSGALGAGFLLVVALVLRWTELQTVRLERDARRRAAAGPAHARTVRGDRVRRRAAALVHARLR